MKGIIGILLIIGGILGGLYVGGWLMFIQPIMDCCKAFDTHILTGTMVGWTVIKCIFATCVGGLIFYVGYVLGMLMLYNNSTRIIKRKFR